VTKWNGGARLTPTIPRSDGGDHHFPWPPASLAGAVFRGLRVRYDQSIKSGVHTAREICIHKKKEKTVWRESGRTAKRLAYSRSETLRIIGGKLRGRKLRTTGEPRTRPMKDRLREAVFNLLGPAVKGTYALDLFGGSGALGLEALSRGAARATLIERHFPTVKLIRQNVATLGLEDRTEVLGTDAFVWVRNLPALPSLRWLVFCSPPYEFYVGREAEMLDLIERLMHHIPSASMLTVESDRRFDPALLPDFQAWDVRRYPPAQLAVYEKT